MNSIIYPTVYFSNAWFAQRNQHGELEKLPHPSVISLAEKLREV
jgi:hypothetical protein